MPYYRSFVSLCFDIVVIAILDQGKDTDPVYLLHNEDVLLSDVGCHSWGSAGALSGTVRLLYFECTSQYLRRLVVILGLVEWSQLCYCFMFILHLADSFNVKPAACGVVRVSTSRWLN
jgi:hypothetical protein